VPAVNVPFLDLPHQIRSLKPEIDRAVEAVLAHGEFILGPELGIFEDDWARFCQVPYAVGVGSGTDALHLILRGLGIGPGDEVITVANTFIATVDAISHAGATPVLVDCRIEDYLIDTAAVAAAITPRTRAIIPVHLYGQPADMTTLAAIAQKAGLALVEDAAQAHGAALSDGRRCGSLGLAAAFSFYPAKNLGAFGDGGAVTTADEPLARQLRLLRNLGSAVKYHHEVIGFNSRLDTLQAAILSAKLRHLAAWNDARSNVASWYRSALGGCPGLVLPVESAWTGRHAYHLYVVRLLERERETVARELAARGVRTMVHYPLPIHLQRAYAGLGKGTGAFPAVEAASHSILSLPMYPEVTQVQVGHVADSLRAVLSA
jgi:dTDP-4-amino-4,6-dideoxygalactose transaminase